MRFPRRLASLILLVFILLNIWYLSSRSAKSDLAGSYARPEPVSDKPDSNPGIKPEEELTGNAKPSAASAVSKAPIESGTPNTKSPTTPGVKNSPAIPQGYGKGYEAEMTTFKQLLEKMISVHPKSVKLDQYDRDVKSDYGLMESGELPMTSTILGMYLKVSDEEVAALKSAHAKVVGALPKELASDAFVGRGIVTTGGGRYFPMVLAALKWIRHVNSHIPVEVFLSDPTEWEPKFCDEVFPKLGAECRVVEDIYGKDITSKVKSKYALKPLAMLASRFKEFYFMDADSFPLNDPEYLFEIKPYTETGLVMNADYWERYISPRYYEIADVELGGRTRGPADSDAVKQGDRKNAVPFKSTESGQMVFDKSRHFRSLLLTLYYNIYGDNAYFPLLMQGGQGEGDKDTYAAAATILDEPWYQTRRRPVTLGVSGADGGYRGYAMVQPDPKSDYERLVEQKDSEEIFLNLHSNSLKANARYLLQDHSEPHRGMPPLQRGRYYGPLSRQRDETLRRNDDVEVRFFEVQAEIVCDWARERGWIPRNWEGQDLERFCGILAAHVDWLRQNPDAGNPELGEYAIDLDYPAVPRNYGKKSGSV